MVEIEGIQVSPLLIGTGDLSRIDGTAMLDLYAELGGFTIDTAHQYTKSELIIGQWMQTKGNREQMVILTKCAHPNKTDKLPRVTPQAVRDDLHESLERLQTDYIDLYALHRDDTSVPVEPIIDELNKHLAAGKVKAIGASNWTWQRMKEANEYAQRSGLKGFSFSSTNLSLAAAQAERWPGCVSADTVTEEWHRSTGIPLIAWSAQAGGFFSGAFTPEDRSNEEMVKVYYNDANWERYRRTQLLAAEKGVSATQIALHYVLHRPFPTCAIIGPRTEAELADSFKALKLKLSQEELEWLNLEREEI